MKISLESRSCRGHETDEHRAMKAEVVRALNKLGFELALREHRCCDVVAIRLTDTPSHVVAVEIERSPRNLLPNLQRNFRQGAENVLIVSPDLGTMAAVCRKLTRAVTDVERCHVGVIDMMALRILEGKLGAETPSTREGTVDANTMD